MTAYRIYVIIKLNSSWGHRLKRLVIHFVLIALLGYSTAAISFSNLIVFGDSLSDNGNFPESPHPFVHPNQAKTVGNTSTSFYVPFSNPVDLAKGSATPPLADINQHYGWPTLNPSFLATPVPIQHGAQTSARQFRSLSWTELLLTYANKQQIIPSYLVTQSNLPSHASINYAWGSALADKGCYNKAYKPFPNCSRDLVIQARQRYMSNPSRNNRYKIIVPGLPKQVDFFLQDLKSGKVQADNKTLYAIWGGGNNMITAYNHLLKGHVSDLFAFMLAKPTKTLLKAASTLNKSLPATLRPKRMYLFNIMDPALTPGYYHGPVALLARVISTSYNFFSQRRVEHYNAHHKLRIVIVPVHHWYKQASQLPYFKAHLGDSCQVKGGNFTQAEQIPNNCEGFMYWNDVHPAVDMQKITAYRFLQLLTKGNQHPAKSLEKATN